MKTMLAKVALSHLMQIMNCKQATMLEELEKKYGQKLTQQSLSDRLSTKKTSNITVVNLNVMLKILGYKLVIVPEAYQIKNDQAILLDDGLAPKAEGETK